VVDLDALLPPAADVASTIVEFLANPDAIAPDAR
jgi:hypothetical protein